MITTNENYQIEEILPKLKEYATGKVVEKGTCAEKSVLPGDGPKVALLDLGAKRNIARSLNQRGCQVTIYPAATPAEEIIAAKPDGIMLSNGPGDPKDCGNIIQEIRKLYETDIPIFAICLGHQLMALATGADTHKMKYGHRGGNHPVKDLKTGRVIFLPRITGTWWIRISWTRRWRYLPSSMSTTAPMRDWRTPGRIFLRCSSTRRPARAPEIRIPF